MMTNDNGGIVEGPFTYSPFGSCSNSAGHACPTGVPYRFTGRRWDDETGLLYFRARYYFVALGRFLQTDPPGYAADMNLYTYVGNDPVNMTDPTGNDRLTVNGGITTDCGTADPCHSYGGQLMISANVPLASISKPPTGGSSLPPATESKLASQYAGAVSSAEAEGREKGAIDPEYSFANKKEYVIGREVSLGQSRIFAADKHYYTSYSEFVAAYARLSAQDRNYGVIGGETPIGGWKSTIYLSGAMDFNRVMRMGNFGFGVWAPSELSALHTVFHEYGHGFGSQPTEAGANRVMEMLLRETGH